MKGQANSVLIAIIAILVLVLAGWYFMAYHASPVTVTVGTSTTTAPTNDPYADTSTWQSYADATDGFSISYPLDFSVDESHGVSTDWRMNANGNPGTLAFTLTVPKIFEPQTNFDDAKLTVGESKDAKAVADCMTPDPSGGPSVSETTRVINGVTFTVFTASDAGAGNLYDSTSYRAIQNGTCFAVEYTIHSSQLANYPASYNLTQFDEPKVKAVLDRIVGTFTFL